MKRFHMSAYVSIRQHKLNYSVCKAAHEAHLFFLFIYKRETALIAARMLTDADGC
jgi:hypothetical protein